MKTIDKRELQKATKEEQKKTESRKGNRNYSEKVRAKWFCCAFKLGFLQLRCKAFLNFYIGFNEYNLNKPEFYLRYIDGILPAFDNEKDSINF